MIIINKASFYKFYLYAILNFVESQPPIENSNRGIAIMMTETEIKDGKKSATRPAKTEDSFSIDVEEMAQAGLHFGQRTSRTHPKMQPYIFGVRNTIHIINLEKTADKLREALEFIKQLASENKIILFVGTKVQIKDPVKETAQESKMPYVVERWLGGTFTNFSVITRRIEHFKELERKKAEGELNKYTKKERIKFDKELQELRKKFGGIKEMSRLPNAVFLCDMRKDHGAIKEARMNNIPIVALCDTNTDPTLADYPIPANDDAISSVKYILEKIKDAILDGQAKSVQDKPDS